MSRKENPNRGTKISDVARLARVSQATASRVLSGSEYRVSPTLRKKVIEAANELNYVAPVQAASPFSYPILSVIVPTLHNPFFIQVIQGIEAVASKNGYQIMIFSSHRSVEEERKNISTLLRARVTALIIISLDDNSSAIENYIACGGKVALIDTTLQIPKTITARTDYYSAGKIAANYLLDNGHKKIAFFTTPLTKSTRQSTLAGVKKAISSAGYKLTDNSLFIVPEEMETEKSLYELEMGKLFTEKYLNKILLQHTAIIAINDLTAFGIIQTLSRYGISIPEDLSIISFDNVPYSRMISPPLTTVELPSTVLGATTCQMLIQSLSGTDDSLLRTTFDFQGKLVERESVKKIRPSL